MGNSTLQYFIRMEHNMFCINSLSLLPHSRQPMKRLYLITFCYVDYNLCYSSNSYTITFKADTIPRVDNVYSAHQFSTENTIYGNDWWWLQTIDELKMDFYVWICVALTIRYYFNYCTIKFLINSSIKLYFNYFIVMSIYLKKKLCLSDNNTVECERNHIFKERYQ